MAADKVFFSYSRFDSDFVLRLTKDLREAGANVWLDQLDIPAGSTWDTEIEKALNNSTCLLAILSEKSIEAVNVMDEVSYALEKQKKVIPVLLHEIDTPFRLRRLQRVDFTKDYQKGFFQLLQALNLKSDGIRLTEKYDTSTAKNSNEVEKELWEEACKINSVSGYKNYLGQTTSSEHMAEAEVHIRQLEKEAGEAVKEREAVTKLKKTGNSGRIFIIAAICIIAALLGGWLIFNNQKTERERTEQDAWEQAIKENTPGAFRNYQKNFRKHSAEAQEKINQLTEPPPAENGLYPWTSERQVTEDDLQGKSSWDLKIMRNEIFARHNFIFKTPEMKTYFAKQPWYNGLYTDVTGQLSSIENVNVNFIKAHER